MKLGCSDIFHMFTQLINFYTFHCHRSIHFQPMFHFYNPTPPGSKWVKEYRCLKKVKVKKNERLLLFASFITNITIYSLKQIFYFTYCLFAASEMLL